LPTGVLERATGISVEAVRALGLANGIAFPQLLAAEDGSVFVVEVAARVPAGQMADLVFHGVGVDLIQIALAQALGRPIPDETVTPSSPRPTVIRFFTAAPGPLPTGRLLAVGGLDRVRSSPGVLDAGLYLELGETIRPVQVDADRRGYVVASGPDTATALASADAAMRKLTVETDRANE
jgi:cysteine synthase A/argininosuccinate lyase